MEFPLRRGMLSLRLLLVIALAAFAVPALGGEMGITCGQPAKTGWVRMYIKVTRPSGYTETAIIEMELSGFWTAEMKALFFRLSVPPGFEDKFEFSGEGTEVTATGKNGWRVSGMGIDNDETNEPDAMLSYVTPSNDLALCSLSGVASGLTATGAPGSFALTVAGHNVLVPTGPGMPAQIIEQQVFSQLMGQGAAVRLATAEDLALVSGVPNDGLVLAIEGLDASGLSEQLQDTGLIVDIAGVVNPLMPPADPAATIPGTEPDGSFFDFGTGSIPALPADFFDPGSDPFEGAVCLAGDPIDADVLGDGSTVIQRSGDPFERATPPGPTQVEVPIELVALSLVSCQPITVTYNGGEQPEPWNVEFGLSTSHPSVGALEATKTHMNGGTFTSTFFVQPRFTFTRVSDGHVVGLDAGLPPLVFSAGDGHWVHEVNPDLHIIAFSDNFVPGVEEVVPGDPLSQQARRLPAHEASGAARHTIFPARFPPTAVPDSPSNEFWVRSFPNPSNPSARIAYAMPARGALSIAIYNLRGERVRALVDGVVDRGAGSVIWDGRDDRGAQMASGIYLCRIAALGRTAGTKITLLK